MGAEPRQEPFQATDFVAMNKNSLFNQFTNAISIADSETELDIIRLNPSHPITLNFQNGTSISLNQDYNEYSETENELISEELDEEWMEYRVLVYTLKNGLETLNSDAQRTNNGVRKLAELHIGEFYEWHCKVYNFAE